ncbi:MAG: domain S-box/diguanylate cyclase protein [Actinomycetia bacterium]|nr:domain S-box/diguanylate cyclase protein [Actinomycetes bacterium]
MADPRRALSLEAIERMLDHATESHDLLDLEGNVLFSIGPRAGVLGHGDRIGNLRDLIHPDDVPFGLDVLGDLVRHPGKTITVYARARAADGSYRLMEFHLANRLDDPVLGGIVARTREATDQGRPSAPALLRSLADVLPSAVVLISADRVLLYANPAACELLDRTLEELRAEGWAPPTPLDKEEHTVEVQHDGRWLSARVVPRFDDEALPMGWVGVLEDITERRQTTQALSYQATHDALTDLPNRGALLEELRRALADAERGPVSLLYVDLDGFKAVNDGHGHAAGDRVLVELGRRLVAVARTSDAVARIGGDEFAVLCRDTPPAVAEVIAGRLVEVIARPVDLDGVSANVGASVGRVTVAASDAGRDAEDVLNQADLAMYEVKRGTR